MIKKILLALVAACVLAFPAQAYVIYVPYTITVPKAEPGDYSRIHTIGVVSAIGGKLRLFKAGGFLDKKTAYRNIIDWKVDDLVRSVIHDTMGQRFTLIDMPVDAATIADKIDPGLFMGNLGPARAFLKDYGRSDIDAYILVRPRYYADFPGGEAGLSLEVSDEGTWVFANYEITLIDGKTFATIGSAFARMRLDDGTPPHFPGLRPRQPFTLDDKIALSDDQVPAFRTFLGGLVRLSMVETLRSLELGLELPRAGGRRVVARPDNALILPAGKRVAVVSALDDTLFLEHLGTMFRHNIHTLATPDLKLDAAVEAQVTAALDRRFQIVPPPQGVDRSKLALLTSNGPSQGVYDGLPAASDIDAYVVVFKRDNTVEGGFPHVGLGLTNWTPIGDEHTKALAGFAIALIDAHTLKVLHVTDGVPSPDREAVSPTAEIDNALWPTEDKPLTAAQDDGLRKVFTEMLADAVPETLLRLGLTDKMVLKPGELPRPVRPPHPPATDDGPSGVETSQGPAPFSALPPPAKPTASETTAHRAGQPAATH